MAIFPMKWHFYYPTPSDEIGIVKILTEGEKDGGKATWWPERQLIIRDGRKTLKRGKYNLLSLIIVGGERGDYWFF